MKYYYVVKDGFDYFNHYAVIAGELMTEKERNKLARYVSDDHFKYVEINKNHVFKNFGVRIIKSDCKDLYADRYNFIS